VHARASRHRTDVAVYRRFVPLLKPSWFPLAVALAASACTPLLFAARIWLLKVLIDTALRGHRPDLLVAVAGGFVVIAVARRVLTFVEDKLSGTVGTPVVRDLRVTVYTHLRGLSLRYFHRHRLGDLLTRLSGDIAAIEDLLVTGLSTIVSLALSYYDPQTGAVALDGHPLHRVDPDSARRQVAAVLQEPMLFDISVAENIRYGRLEPTDAVVAAAAGVAQADEFIRALPQGYDTPAGPRGTRLSGGHANGW